MSGPTFREVGKTWESTLVALGRDTLNDGLIIETSHMIDLTRGLSSLDKGVTFPSRVLKCTRVSLRYRGKFNCCFLFANSTTITGLRSTGEVFDPFVKTDGIIGFNSKQVSFTNFIIDHFDEATTEVSYEEDMVFLSLWLSHFIFYLSSLQVTKSYVTLANQFHVGRTVCLRKLILASLYEASSLASSVMKTLSLTKNPKGTLLLMGPFWHIF